jgi:hypothetical protein
VFYFCVSVCSETSSYFTKKEKKTKDKNSFSLRFLLYFYLLLNFHQSFFNRMKKKLTAAAETSIANFSNTQISKLFFLNLFFARAKQLCLLCISCAHSFPHFVFSSFIHSLSLSLSLLFFQLKDKLIIQFVKCCIARVIRGTNINQSTLYLFYAILAAYVPHE